MRPALDRFEAERHPQSLIFFLSPLFFHRFYGIHGWISFFSDDTLFHFRILDERCHAALLFGLIWSSTVMFAFSTHEIRRRRYDGDVIMKTAKQFSLTRENFDID